MHELIAISAAIFSPDRGKVLAIKRSQDPRDILAGLWGLPAVLLAAQETEYRGVARIGWQKLGTEVQPVNFIGEKTHQKSRNLQLTMRVWECAIDSDPHFSRRDMQDPHVSQYVDWQWMDPKALIPTAQKGSLCTQLLLESKGIIYEQQS